MNQFQRKMVEALVKRQAWLTSRINAGAKNHNLSHDRRERAALRFALGVIQLAENHNLINPKVGQLHEEEA